MKQISKKISPSLLLIAMIVGVMGISSAHITASASNYLKADATNPYGGAAIDPLPDTAIIFSVKNGAKTINYSKIDLLAIKSTVITIFEPFVGKTQRFTAIPLDYFLGKSSISPSKRIDTIALNDYIYTNKAANFSKAKAYVAFKRFGKDIPYNLGGPLRLVYANSSSWSKNLDAWNWSLRSIKVRTTG